jgi:hypothetical protein
MVLRLLPLVLVPALLASTPASRSVRDGWSQPTTIASAGNADSTFWSAPRVAFDGHGRATAVWVTSSGQTLLGQEADWSRGRGWSSPRTLWKSGPLEYFPQQLAVDARGDAIVIWSEQTAGGVSRIWVDYRQAGRAWQPPRAISPLQVQTGFPVVAIDGHGRALVAWAALRDDEQRSLVGVEVVARRPNGTWSRPHVLCACRTAPFLSLAMNASGRALVAWLPQTGPATIATASPTGRWAPPQAITGLNGYLLQAAMNDRGTAVVLGVDVNLLTASVRRGYGRFGPAQSIGDFAYWGSALALTPNGEAVVMWADECCLAARARLPNASAFGSPQSLGFGDAVPTLAMDARGNTLALWTHSSNGVLYLDASQRPRGGRFGAATTIGQVGIDCYKHQCCPGSPSVAATGKGQAVAVWLVRPDPAARTCTAVEAATFTP